MKQYFIYIAILGIGIIIGLAISRMEVQPIREILPQSCTHNGVTYKDGEGFNDECNSCSCQNGEVMCTAMACDVELP